MVLLNVACEVWAIMAQYIAVSLERLLPSTVCLSFWATMTHFTPSLLEQNTGIRL